MRQVTTESGGKKDSWTCWKEWEVVHGQYTEQSAGKVGDLSRSLYTKGLT